MPHHVSVLFIAEELSTLIVEAVHLSPVVWCLQFFTSHITPLSVSQLLLAHLNLSDILFSP